MADFEADLTAALGEKMKADDAFCSLVWGALSNVDWYHPGDKTEYSCSFRYAGGVVAEISGRGDYMTYYCSSPDGVVPEEIAHAMKKHGWISDTIGAICDEPGCIKQVTCGTPTKDGYRNTCSEHSPRERSQP